MTSCSGDEVDSVTQAVKQNPPATNAADIAAWIAKGYYQSWKCEPAAHPSRDPSPHGNNRICSNDVLSAAGAGPFPVDSSAVKELLDDSNKIVGYATYRKVKAGNGEAFYWYETVPLNSPAPHDASGIVAAGLGSSGPAKDICVGCHMGAGSDAKHSGHDFVYTQVR